jgi:hypothetical protein
MGFQVVLCRPALGRPRFPGGRPVPSRDDPGADTPDDTLE